MSTPSFSAERAWRMVTHLWIEIRPAFLKRGTHVLGLEPAVSTMRTPDSMMTRAYSSYGGGAPIVGRIVKLTPNGFEVSERVRSIHFLHSSGVPALCAANM